MADGRRTSARSMVAMNSALASHPIRIANDTPTSSAPVLGTRLVIADTSNSRVLVYDRLFGSVHRNAEADIALGQRSLFEGLANAGGTTPSAATLAFPGGVFFNGYELFVADTGNSRLVTYR